ncbi:hypothetical protein [Lysinibacillus fusiformis]|uniref:hypothetical protein n=1 Tax=Lysinibacillus fusiformis TaxID=28031 RepID=UPI003AF32EA2
MRCGEACGLQWKNINFKENTITIERSRDYGGTHKPKTLNSYYSSGKSCYEAIRNL